MGRMNWEKEEKVINPPPPPPPPHWAEDLYFWRVYVQFTEFSRIVEILLALLGISLVFWFFDYIEVLPPHKSYI